jgi:hypothetical protein
MIIPFNTVLVDHASPNEASTPIALGPPSAAQLFNGGHWCNKIPIITIMPSSLQTLRPRPQAIYLSPTRQLFPSPRTTLSAPITPRQGPRSPWNALSANDRVTEAGFPDSPTLFIQQRRLEAALGNTLPTRTWTQPSPEVETQFLQDPDQSIMEYNHRLKEMQPWYW